MRIYNKYVISLVLACCVLNTMLAFLSQNDLGIYLAVNVVAYLSITLLYVYFNPRARKALNSVAAVLFTGFVVIVILEIMDIVSGR